MAQRYFRRLLDGKIEAPKTPQSLVYASSHTDQYEECDAQGNPLQGQSQTIQTPFGSVTVRGLRATSAPISANIPVLKKTVDPAEQKLLDKVIPKFNGEARCDHSEANLKLRKAPKQPFFDGDLGAQRNQSSMKAIKRWVSSNFVAFPICRFTRESCSLVFDSRPETGGQGEYMIAYFECGCR